MVPIILKSDYMDLVEQDCACADSDMSPSVVCSSATESTDTDCACSERGSEPHSGRALFDASVPWQQVSGLYRDPLLSNFEIVANLLSNTGVALLNEPALHILDAYRLPSTLASATGTLQFLDVSQVRLCTEQLVALKLLSSSNTADFSPSQVSQTLVAWIHVTNACNLRCTYCYLNKSRSSMTGVIGRAAVDSILRSALKHDFQTVKLKYGGGEPTLNFPLVMHIHAYAKRQATECGLRLKEVVLSNAIGLTPVMIRFMRDERIQLMISLDDVGGFQNAQRISGTGRSSSLKTMQAIECCIVNGLFPHLSITVTTQNINDIAEVVSYALERDLTFNLNFLRAGTSMAATMIHIDEARLISGIRRAFDVIKQRLPSRSLFGMLLDRSMFGQPHDYACGAGHSYLVIDEQGCIARCQMQIEKKLTDVFAEDPLTVVVNSREGFQNVAIDEKVGCTNCEWRYSCAGGCPLLTFNMFGRNSAVSPYCRVYKALYPDLLRLEGLRLLKWMAGEAHESRKIKSTQSAQCGD